MPLVLSGDGAVGPLSATEVSYLDGVTSAVQTQLNGKLVSPNIALINTGGTLLTGATTITVSGISGKSIIFIEVSGASSASASSSIRIRCNADSSASYKYSLVGINGTAAFAEGATTNQFTLANMGNSAANTVSGYCLIQGSATSGIKSAIGCGYADGTTTNASFHFTGAYYGTDAITSVSIISTSGNFDAGTVYVYGA